MFHVGHLNLLRAAKSMCESLIVGVTVDDLVKYKGKNAVVPYEERIDIVRSCKFVDMAVPQTCIDKFEAWKRLKYDAIFVGDDWFNTPSWNELEGRLNEVGAVIVYLPYTKHTSSTKFAEFISNYMATTKEVAK